MPRLFDLKSDVVLRNLDSYLAAPYEQDEGHGEPCMGVCCRQVAPSMERVRTVTPSGTKRCSK